MSGTARISASRWRAGRIAAGIRPHTLGADMHGYNVRVPGDGDTAARQENPFFGVAPFNLTHAMTELMTLGITLPEIVATVTSNPARMLQMEDSIGALLPDARPTSRCSICCAGASRCRTTAARRSSQQEMLTPAFAVRAGKVVAGGQRADPAAGAAGGLMLAGEIIAPRRRGRRTFLRPSGNGRSAAHRRYARPAGGGLPVLCGHPAGAIATTPPTR